MALPPIQCEGYDLDWVDKDGPMLNVLGALPKALAQPITPTVGRVFRVDYSGTRGGSY